ncbi:hypothetical protein [Cohnella soli]|uniref:Serine hydroxymethyltransferase-like domain-containing protein n=1 Tax=Cohnella soli TaxID=425005 RepID=A0ABW0I5G3_9BACL
MNIEILLDALIEHEETSRKTLNLVPSENAATRFSRIPLLLDLYNRYFFHAAKDHKRWSFRGVQDIHWIETDVVIPLLRDFTNAEYISVRPVSGMGGMLLALLALGGGVQSHVLTVSPEQGGHYATRNLAMSIGLNPVYLAGEDEYSLDLNKVEHQLKQMDVKLVYVDQSNGLFPFDIRRLVQAVKRISPTTLIHVDISHWLGLVFGGEVENPLDAGADSFGGSTHKTFPGPQKAIFCTRNNMLAMKAKFAQHYSISSHHFGSVVSLAIALLEFKTSGQEYSKRTVENARALARYLDAYRYDVKGSQRGFTAGHQIWMSTHNRGIDSYEASERLYHSGIRVNAFDEMPGSKQSMLRIGVNEVTRIGATQDHMEELARLMNAAILQSVPMQKLRAEVELFRNSLKDDYGFGNMERPERDKFEKLIALIGL